MPEPFYKANIFALLFPWLFWVCFKVTWGDLGLLFKPSTSSNPITSHLCRQPQRLFLTDMRDFVGLPNKITSEHLSSPATCLTHGWGLKDDGSMC